MSRTDAAEKAGISRMTLYRKLQRVKTLKRNWELDELIDHFILMPDEQEQIQLKRGNTKLGFAVMFKFFNTKLGSLIPRVRYQRQL